jgi:hypothetical protein
VKYQDQSANRPTPYFSAMHVYLTRRANDQAMPRQTARDLLVSAPGIADRPLVRMSMVLGGSTSPQLQPRVADARRFLDLLAGPGATVTFQTYPEALSGGASGDYASVLHGTLDDHLDTLISLNQRGSGIFVMINEGDGITAVGAHSCRTASNVKRVRAHFVDLDGAPLQPVLCAGIHPDIVVQSSEGRWHAYWLVDGCPLEDFRRVQEALNQKFDADPSVKDLPRVLRVPGFFNHKRELPEMVRLVTPVLTPAE